MGEETLTWFNKLSLLVPVNIADMQTLNLEFMYFIAFVFE